MKLKNKIIPGVVCAAFYLPFTSVMADQQIPDDLVVVGSICVGLDCVNNESFGFDTIRLKENNLRIRFMDTSAASSFPTVDWQITVNDSLNGGQNWFGIEDLDAGTTPFSILATAPNNSLYISASGKIGLGTTTPLVNLVIKGNNTPTLRLEQDTGAGFTAQVWDVGGNETNFFVRDVTNGSQLPFRITPNAPGGSIYIAADGDVGFETITPDGLFDVAHSADANNHAFLIDPNSNVGVNIDSGQIPKGLFDVQTTGGVSRFTVQTDGDVGVGTSDPSGRFDVKGVDGVTNYFNIDASGKIGVGSLGSTSAFNIDDDVADITPTLSLRNVNTSNQHGVLLSLQNNDNSYIEFLNTATSPVVEKWYLGSRVDGNITLSHSGSRMFELDSNGNLTVSGTVSGGSSVTLKENISSIDASLVLDQLSQLNILKWNYINDDDEVKHIGPLSEDFHNIFGLNGEEKERISYNDLAGVSLAAIKALIEKNNELERKMSELIDVYNK